MTWGEPVAVVPASRVVARSGKAGAYTKFFQQSILVQGEIGRVDAIELFLKGAASKLHVAVTQQRELSRAAVGSPPKVEALLVEHSAAALARPFNNSLRDKVSVGVIPTTADETAAAQLPRESVSIARP